MWRVWWALRPQACASGSEHTNHRQDGFAPPAKSVTYPVRAARRLEINFEFHHPTGSLLLNRRIDDALLGRLAAQNVEVKPRDLVDEAPQAEHVVGLSARDLHGFLLRC